MVPKPAGATSLATYGTVVARSLQPLRIVQTGSYRSQVRLFRCCVQGSLMNCWFVFYRIHRYSLFERLNCLAEMIYSWFLWCFLVAFFPESHGSKVLQSKLSVRNTQITFRHSAVLCPQWSWRVFGASPCLETLLCTITSKHLCESMMLSGKRRASRKIGTERVSFHSCSPLCNVPSQLRPHALSFWCYPELRKTSILQIWRAPTPMVFV